MMKPRLTIEPGGFRRCVKPLITAFVALVATCGQLLADPLKATMGEMAKTTKEAKAALSASDAGTFDAILKAYADEGRAGMALFAGGSAKNQDLRARFSTFAGTADAARKSQVGPAKFKATFGSLVNECRSCHSVYK